MKIYITKSLLFAVIALALFQSLAAEQVTIKQLLAATTSWNGAPLPPEKTELRVLRYKIEPGGKTTIHVHPFNGAGYLISGELTMYSTEDPNGSFVDPKKVKEVRLVAGDAWAETINIWHYGENKGSTAAEFILFFDAQVGTPSTLSLGTRKE